MDDEIRSDYIKTKRRILEKEYSFLNEKQKEAVFQANGPLLVLAGAGSGKTTMLVERIGYLVKYGNAYKDERLPDFVGEDELGFLESYEMCLDNAPDSITDEHRQSVKDLISADAPPAWSVLAITFTNKAAAELKARLKARLGDQASDVWAFTFHSFCVRVLRRDIDQIDGYFRDFTIYDTDDSIRVIKESLKELNISDKNFPPRNVLSIIGKFKDAMVTPDKAKESVSNDFRLETIVKVYALYQKKLKAANALDFDDIIMLTVQLITESEEVRNYYQRRFRYVLVDEYQDTNHAQYNLVSLLANAHKNICVVGDDDQSIYKFRGANIENILSFEKQFDNATVIRLEENYRSTGHILDAANKLISNNSARKGKNLWTKNPQGDKVTVYRAIDETDEGQFITDQILDGVGENASFSDFAVLYRTNAQSNPIERVLVKSAVPYRVVGGFRFYERKEIKDVISYFCLIHNPSDNLRFSRIINEPKRGVGAGSLAALSEVSEREGISYYECAARANEFPELKRSAQSLMEFYAMMEDVKDHLYVLPLHEVLEYLLEKSGYLEMLRKDKDPGAADRIENITELSSNIMIYEKDNEDASLAGFLEEVSLMSDIDSLDSAAEAVTLMTIHSAKGLEFPTVFLAGMEEGLFPGMRSMYDPQEIEEERRLAYVGVTRAKKRLYMSYCMSRMIYGKTSRNPVSRFVTEIPDEYKDMQSANILEYRGVDVGDHGGAHAGGHAPIHPDKPHKTAMSVGPITSSKASYAFSEGEMVSHRVFGTGMVISSRPMGNDTLLEVAFEKVGTKRLMANFANLKPAK